MSELKPCPFCGGTASQVTRDGYYLIQCGIDNPCYGIVETGDYETPAEAITAWNTRTDSDTARVLYEISALGTVIQLGEGIRPGTWKKQLEKAVNLADAEITRLKGGTNG